MRWITFLLFFGLLQPAQGQKSYDFADPIPPAVSSIATIDKSFHGKYFGENTERVFEVNPNGIFIHINQVQSINRETIRESSKYQLRGDYLHGIVDNDSVRVVQEGELYYFGLPITEQIVGGRSQNVLKKVQSNVFILNFWENETYIPCLLTFDSEELRIQYFDYEADAPVFEKMKVVSSSLSDGMRTVTLGPTPDQFNQINLSEIFGKVTMYSRLEDYSKD
jgi:hypothetical protein